MLLLRMWMFRGRTAIKACPHALAQNYALLPMANIWWSCQLQNNAEQFVCAKCRPFKNGLKNLLKVYKKWSHIYVWLNVFVAPQKSISACLCRHLKGKVAVRRSTETIPLIIDTYIYPFILTCTYTYIFNHVI